MQIFFGLASSMKWLILSLMIYINKMVQHKKMKYVQIIGQKTILYQLMILIDLFMKINLKKKIY